MLAVGWAVVPKRLSVVFGVGRCVVEVTSDRCAASVPPDYMFVSTHGRYVALGMQQLPEVPGERILAESQRRNTAPCVAWAAYHIRALDPEATLVVTPADHLILREEVFRGAILQGMDFVEELQCLPTLGGKPTRAETGSGYIQIGDESKGAIRTVKPFTEKTNRPPAQVLQERAAVFWNSGL